MSTVFTQGRMSQQPTTDIPPPAPPPRITQQLRNLKPKQSLFFTGTSVKSMLTRVRGEFPNREYTTRREGDGVRVWRLT